MKADWRSPLPEFLAPPPRSPLTPTEAALLDLLNRTFELEQITKAQAEVIRRQQMRLDHLEAELIEVRSRRTLRTVPKGAAA
jgi:hypothetical protein